MLLNGEELLDYIEYLKKTTKEGYQDIENKFTKQEIKFIEELKKVAIYTLETIEEEIKDGTFNYKENK